MKTQLTIVGLCVALCAVLAVGCKSGAGGSGKCEKAIDKAVSMASEMMKGMSAMAGDNEDAKKQMEAKMKEAMDEMNKKKPEIVKACAEELEKNKDAEKVLDCMIEAKALQDMQKCDSIAKVDFMNKMAP
jgi:hypothetical protein